MLLYGEDGLSQAWPFEAREVHMVPLYPHIFDKNMDPCHDSDMDPYFYQIHANQFYFLIIFCDQESGERLVIIRFDAPL